MYLFSGAFYPIDQLPVALEWVARILPVWHGVVLVQRLIVGTDLPLGVWHVAVLLGYTAVGIAIGGRMFTKALGK